MLGPTLVSSGVRRPQGLSREDESNGRRYKQHMHEEIHIPYREIHPQSLVRGGSGFWVRTIIDARTTI